ncbi:putative beta-1,3-glucanase, Osmotin/thaumatin-like superfamily, glucan endo-1,3-beta-glucosidase [Septoria linicola]|nr:putative beta-1,3-glucanase, Osmotin/thaumatin-like superfamily, glucan endo-1,3-beta-glucosidase [Septoria linicola]
MPEAKTQVCGQLGQASSLEAPWADGCLYADDKLIRVLSPDQVMGTNPATFSGYFDDHIRRFLSRYAAMPLIVQLGDIQKLCTGNPDDYSLSCEGSSAIHFQPTAGEVFTCTGPFLQGDTAVMHRICAAMNRGTLLQAGGEVQPSVSHSSYYTNDIHNVHSSAVHGAQQGGLGYAFSRDDIEPSIDDAVSGLICTESDDVEELKIFVGGRA